MTTVMPWIDDDSTSAPLIWDLEHVFRELTPSELDNLAIGAMRAYWTSMVVTENARLERVAAENDANCSPDHLAKLVRTHQQVEFEHRLRQLVLNTLIDRLGYVPRDRQG